MPGIATALIYIGLTESSSGNRVAAIRSYREALTMFEETNNQFRSAECLNNLSTEYWLLGDYAQAKLLAQRSVTIVREIGPRQFLANVLDTLGHATQSLGQYQEASAY